MISDLKQFRTDLLVPNHHPTVKRDIKKKVAKARLAKYTKRPLCVLCPKSKLQEPCWTEEDLEVESAPQEMGKRQEVEHQGLGGHAREEDKQDPLRHVGRKGASGPHIIMPHIFSARRWTFCSPLARVRRLPLWT